MQKSEFEKQMQQKMDELKMHPSESVWPKIEVQIKKEKRRRWILILIPVMLFCFLYGGYLLPRLTNTPREYGQETKKSISKNIIPGKTKAGLEPIKNELPRDKTLLTTIKTLKPTKDQKIIIGKLTVNKYYQPVKSLGEDTVLRFKNEIDITKNTVENEKLNKTDIQTAVQQELPGKADQPDSAENVNNKLLHEVIADSKKEENKNKPAIAKNNKSKKHLWNWGVSFSGGVSGLTSGLSGQKSLNGRFNSSGIQVPNAYFTPSLIKSSIAFITGVSAGKNISRKTIFSAGLNYKLFSTTNKSGVDSIYLIFYNNKKTAHNFYHYIEIPVEFKIQIGNSERVPLYWNAGFSVAQLISSNALQFNNATGFYYKDNAQFNKTQFGFNTGLDIGLISKEKKLFLIGPYINYGISKIGNGGLYNKNHFSFIGLRAQLVFRKN